MARTMTPSQIALAKEKPTLSSIVTKQSYPVVVGLITMLVADTVRMLNVGKTMTAEQALDASRLIITDFSHLKVADIQLAFNRARAQRYGAIFDRLDSSVILGWVASYEIERQNEIIQHRVDEASKHKIKVPDISPVVLDGIKTVLAEKKEQKVEEIIEKTPVSTQFQIFYRQFDKLYLKFGIDNQANRFIKRYNKTMDVMEYVEYKFEQLKRVSIKHKN